MRKRAAVYSSSRRAPLALPAATPPKQAEAPRKPAKRRRRSAWAAAGAVLLLLGSTAWVIGPSQRGMREESVEAAPPEKQMTAADAYEHIRPSVVLVRGLPYDGTEEVEGTAKENTGTGVVIVDDGTILTNLHVVHGAKRVKVVFFDGFEADAEVIGVWPEHDLAVLRAKAVPDDLEPATMRSTNSLRVGDDVVAVGFPFGIGPSASAGVISGLGREYHSVSGERLLTNLIQFDAAVNPGNSGGPLVTTDGEVVGIVTGLLNPTEQRVFIGIGFAVPIENAAGAVGL
jgi:S1-C subfamily serine protease